MSVVLSPLDRELVQLTGQYAVPALLGLARIGTCFAWLPYLSSGAISSAMARSVIAVAVLIGMWPAMTTAQVPQGLLPTLLATCSEALIGTAMGLMISLPFHIFHALGAIVDNQRGASISAAVDPLSGIEATETANLLQMTATALFLATGGVVAVVQVILSSYELVPMGGTWAVQGESVMAFMGLLLAEAVRMSMPVLLLLLVVEVFLGLLARFAEQLNPFAVSLGVKSFVAFIALLVYLMWTMVEQVPVLWNLHDGLELIKAPVTQ